MMNTTSSAQTHQQATPVPFSSDESSIASSPSFVSQPMALSSVLIPRSALADHRLKSRAGAADIDGNKLSTTIKRSQAISNIQDLDEDSPVTFVIEPHEHFHGRKKVQLQSHATSMGHRPVNDSILSMDKQPTNSNGGGDESDTRSESSEKNPEYIEEEKPILLGIHVKGATLNRLIRILIDSFREWLSNVFIPSLSFFSCTRLEFDGTLIDDNEYPKVFFLMHKWIMESEYLSNMLYDLYKHTEDDLRRANNTADEGSFKSYQFRICQAYQYVAHRRLFARISMCLLCILAASGWRTIRCISISINAWKKPARRWKI